VSLRIYYVGVARLAWPPAAQGWCASCGVRRRSAQVRLVFSNMLGLEQ